MQKSLIIFSLSFFLILSNGYSQNVLLVELIQEAIDNNAQLKAFYHSYQQTEAKIQQAGSLPDPILFFNLINLPVNSFDFDREPMTGKQISLTQHFPFPGKLGVKERIAKENSSIANEKYQELRNHIIKEVKNRYFNLFFIDKSIETTKKNRALLQEFVKIAETRYSVGKGLQQDVLKAQVELSNMTDRLINLEQKRETVEAQLNTLLNRPVESEAGNTIEPEFIPLTKDFKDMKALTLKNRPLIKAWEAMKIQSDQKISLAKREYLPDFSIIIAYTQREVLQSGMGGVDFFSGGVSLNVPLYFWRKQAKKVQETEYEKKSVEEQYVYIQNQVLLDLDNRLTDTQKNAKLIDLYKTGIIPQASQSLESAMTGYQTDKVDFLTLVSNQMTLFNYELDYFRVLSDYNKNIAELEFIVGGRIE
jgi:cobalt-zinc-cadmium efflux system outer membrane protein